MNVGLPHTQTDSHKVNSIFIAHTFIRYTQQLTIPGIHTTLVHDMCMNLCLFSTAFTHSQSNAIDVQVLLEVLKIPVTGAT